VAAEALERGDYGGVAAADVDQRRQLEVCRQLQLRFEQRLLAFAVEGFEEVIQADLAHGAQLPMTAQARQPVAECAQVCGAMLIEVHRMQPERCNKSASLAPDPTAVANCPDTPPAPPSVAPRARGFRRARPAIASKSGKSRWVWLSISSTFSPVNTLLEGPAMACTPGCSVSLDRGQGQLRPCRRSTDVAGPWR
jgi:hypothetical protein